MKKIYITGIAGLLGNNLAKELQGRYEITGVDCIDTKIFDIKYEIFDVCDYQKLKSSIETAKPDILIHTIAVVDVDKCERNKELAEKINADLTREISLICSKNNIKMIYISTDAVFDGKEEKLYEESDSTLPLNEYAKSKLKGEVFVREDENNLILRTNIYGINVQNKKSFGEWIVSALKNNEELHMFEDIFFSPILVNDLAEVIDKCIQNNLCGLYHACATGAISKYDFGMRMKEVFGIRTGKIHKTTSDSMNFKAPRSKNMGMSNEKLKKVLNIQICTPEESIEHFCEIYKNLNRKLEK